VRVDPNYLNGVAAAIDKSSGLESSLTQQLSSGLRVTSLDVDPSAVANSAMIGSAIAKDDSFVQSASGVQSMLQVADSTLGEVVSQVTSALTLAVQGANGTQNAANTLSIAQQLTGIRDQVLSLANTSYTGSYLFGGTQGAAAPFSLDNSTTPATVVYAGDNNTRSVETPTGQKIQVSVPGNAVFGGGGSTGVLTVLNQLIADFSSGTASASTLSDTDALTNALHQVSTQRGILDSGLNRLEQTSTYAQTDESQLTAQQGALVSANLADVATKLQSAETQHQALLSVMTTLNGTNLFSYMK
jgi:flagellar hook-associated protein 3 FlgL